MERESIRSSSIGGASRATFEMSHLSGELENRYLPHLPLSFTICTSAIAGPLSGLDRECKCKHPKQIVFVEP
jgi:hypothetical protein